MNELIKYFNNKYSKTYGKIAYPRTTIQIYRVYQAIKSYGIKDEELVKLLHNVKLPKPRNTEEWELYVYCLYNKDDSEMVIDTSNLISKENPVFTGSMSLGRKEGTTIGGYSAAIGYDTEASGCTSHAEGQSTTASEYCSHAEGDGTIASGECSHAEGSETTALGECSHAEGDNTTAVGDCSHAEGSGTQASGNCSHAEGGGTVASGSKSHAEGTSTAAPGDSSHSEGKYTGAPGNCSHAEGYNTKASSDYQHVQGKFNIEDTTNKYAHIVGNGNNNNKRSNAHTLDWDGNAWFAGKLSQEGTPTEDKDLVTKKYVDDSRDNLISNIYGRVYDFQITEDEFNSLYDFVYNYLWIDKPNNEIILNSISKEDLNQVIDDDIGYEAILFNNKIILELNSTGSNGITLYNKFESAEGSIYYYLFSLKSNESNVTIFSFNNSIKYNYSDKIITMATISNKVNLVTNTKNQYINVTEDLEITLPNVVEYTEIHLYFSPSSTVSITFPPSIKWKDVPTIEANKVYEIIFKYINEKIGWIGEYKIYN